MKTFNAIWQGFLSGIWCYIAVAMFFIDPKNSPNDTHVGLPFIALFLGWILTAYVIRRNARSAVKAFSRGALIGAAEWLLVIPLSFFYSLRIGDGSTAAAGASILFTTISGGFAITMAVVCLICYAVAYFLGREMKPDMAAPPLPLAPPEVRKRCPQCAEWIMADALKCRYCGASTKDETPESKHPIQPTDPSATGSGAMPETA